MKKISKIVAVLGMTVLGKISTVFAGTGDKITPSNVDGTQGSSDLDVGGITTIGNDIVRIITTAGVVVSVIVLVVLGIKYMMGSAEEKAEYKKTLIPYIIGAALVFAASAVATIIYNFATGVNITAAQ